MTGAATATAATGAGGGPGAHPAARRALVTAAALETTYRHHSLNITGLALGTIYGLIASKNQLLELLTALAALEFENRHFSTPAAIDFRTSALIS